MSRRFETLLIPAITLLIPAVPSFAHVPYLEETDYTLQSPFVVEDAENSKSFHSVLETSDDFDVYRIAVDEPTRIYTTTNIPFCAQYETYSVTYALIGPGLPAIDAEQLPVALPAGYGGVIVRNPVASVDERPVFFEPYGGRLMWEGPEFMIDATAPGEYQMIVWNENGEPGDYIGVIGQLEYFGPAEISQAMQTSPKLKDGRNLLADCNPQADAVDRRTARR